MKNFNLKSCKEISIYLKRIFFLSTMFLFGSLSLYSQCKLERVKDDFGSGSSAYTKDVTLASVFPLVGSKKPWDLVMHFLLVDGSLSISVTHQSQKYSTTLSSIFFKFNDGTIIKKEEPSTSGDYNTGLGYSYTWTGFDLTKEELMIFASKGLLKFQCDFSYFPDYPVVEQDIKEKSAEKIKRDASCLLDEYNSNSIAIIDQKVEDKEELNFTCGYELDKIDVFTKKRSVLTSASKLYYQKVKDGACTLQVSGSNINGLKGVKFSFGNYFAQLTKYQEVQDYYKNLMGFDQVEILLENDDAINLKNETISEFLIDNKESTAWSNQQFTVENDSTWQKLKSISAKSIRVSLKGKGVLEWNVEQKYAKSFSNVINCVDALGIPKSK